MKPESLLKFGVYYNRNDPRVWVYRHDKYKAVGVTLNFAKTAAWVWLALLIGSLFVNGERNGSSVTASPLMIKLREK